jgi:hypothetical protein
MAAGLQLVMEVVALVLQLVDLIFVVAQLALEQLAIRVAATANGSKKTETKCCGKDRFHIRLMRKNRPQTAADSFGG